MNIASWVSWLRLLVAFSLCALAVNGQACVFPESESQPFFFDVPADTPPDSVIVDTIVEPPNATLHIVSVRSGNLPQANFTKRFVLESRAKNGQFMIINKEPLLLPSYPSTVVETYLYMTVMCNKQAYPLITIRVRSGNLFKPRFYNAPYSVLIPENSPVGTVIPTSITAVDWDPSDVYSVGYNIESGNGNGALELEIIDLHGFDPRFLPQQFGDNYTQEQLPPSIGIRVMKPLRQQKYMMRISATDETNYALKSFASVIADVVSMADVVPRFSSNEYYATYSPSLEVGTEILPDQPVVAIDGNETLNRQIVYFLEETEFSALFYLDPKTARLLVKNKPTKDLHLGRSLTIQAYQVDLPNRYGSARLWLVKPNGTSTSKEVAYFDPCSYEITMDENPPFGAIVATLRTHGSEAMVSLENGTSMLTLDKSGEIKVNDNKKFDREEVEKITIVASLQLSKNDLLKSPCPVATVTIKLRDVNDNAPVFDRNAYHFKLENNPGNNTLVGTLNAADKDQGENARISFSILNDENVFAPFYMYGGEIYYLQPDIGFELDSTYVLYVEALDFGNPRRAARVTVTIDVQPPGSFEDVSTSKEKLIVRQKKLKPQLKDRFEVAHYAFSVYGRITNGQYVGSVSIPSNVSVTYKLEDNVKQLFTLDQTNGQINVDNSSMLSDYNEVRFAVTALIDGKEVASCTVTVLLDETQSIYEVAPRFEQVLYRFKIVENSEPASIGVVQAYHRAAEQQKDTFSYEILASNDSNKFKIDQKSGELWNVEALDYESKRIYNLRVSACLVSHGTVCGHSDLSVMVEDVNDNPPVFKQSTYSITVPHDLPLNSEIIKVQATDLDGGRNSAISYSIENGSELVHINENNGQIILIHQFTSIEPQRLIIAAFDSGTPPLKGTTTVNINIGGSNPSAPEFDQFRYEFKQKAPVPVGAVLVEVHASDPDPGLEGEVKYRLARTDLPQVNKTIDKFFINPENGKLSTLSELSEEEDGSNIQLLVEAYDQSETFPRQSQTVVSINIDYNDDDHVEFSPLPNTVYISVDKGAGSTILHAPARSVQNSELEYYVDQAGLDLFEMVGDSLIIKTKLPEGEFAITLKATTSTGTTGVHQIRIVAMKDRDKYPVFSQLRYQTTVDPTEGFPVKLDVVRASQAKGTFKYTLFPNNPIGVLIDPETGVITIERQYIESHGQQSPLFLVIRAINQDFPEFYSDAGVNIKLSDGAETFSFPTKLYRMQLSENSELNTILSTPVRIINAEFIDNLTYTVKPDEHFIMDSSSRLKLIKPLDLEKLHPNMKGIINLVVTAHYGNESSSTNVQVKVTDENEFVPVFKQTNYQFNLTNQTKGDILGYVLADDMDTTDTTLEYKKISGDAENYITVLPNGTIILNEIPQNNISFSVEALDSGGNAAEAEVNIRVLANVEPSVNPGPDTTTPENTTPGSTAGAVQSESTESSTVLSTSTSIASETTTQNHLVLVDNLNWTLSTAQSIENSTFIFTVPRSEKRWSFTIPYGNEDKLVNIEPVNSTAVELRMFDQISTTEEERTIVVEGIDQNDPNNVIRSNVTIKFPEKRSLPVIEPIRTEVKVNPKTEETIIKVNATVPDGAEPVVFTLKENPQDQFKIDSNTGAVSYAIDEADRKDGLYNIVVKAESNGQASEVTIPIEVDKIPDLATPTFAQKDYTFSVVENPATETAIGHLQVNGMTDPDNLILYFEPDWANQVLTIDPHTGTITLQHIPDKMLKNDFKHLKVTAENVQDHTKSSTVLFSLVLPRRQHVPAPTARPTVRTTQKTSVVTKRPTETTKTTSTAPSVKMTPKPTTPTVPAIGPRFNKNGYRSSMLEGRYGGGTVLTLKPEPFQVIGMSKPTYAIDSPDPTLPFFIRNETGQIVIVGDVDREQNPVFKFDVVATDPTDSSQQARTSVNITILDVNDNYPRFVNGPKLVAVNDSLPMNTVIATYEAVDDDEGALGKVYYRVKNDEKKIFSVNSFGELKLSKPLQSSNETLYDIIVEAMDGGRPALKTSYQVHVEVFSAVSTAPLFKEESYEATVPLDAETGFIVTELLAGTKNYSYELSDSFSQLFVAQDNGAVILGRKPIESEQNRFKVLNVTAKDNEGQSSTTQLNVFFEGKAIVVNVSTTTESPESGPCQFTSKIFNAEIKENLSGKQKVTTVTSNCELMQKNVRYAIVQATKEFEIDEVSGVISVNTPLDREKRSTHFIIVNLTEITEETESQERNIRHTPVIHPIADFMKNRLSPGQSMIVLHVLDENDNAPTFLKVNREGEYVFSIDAQIDPPSAVARVYAFDPDEKAKVTYNISETTPTDHFFMNDTNGVIYIKKPLTSVRYKFTAVASDGLHETSVPVWLYTISMENNIAVVVSDKNRDDINEAVSSKKLSEMLNAEVKIVDKKPYSDNQGNFDTQRSLLYVYALDKQSRVPLTGSDLKSMLSQQMDHLGASELRVSGISLPVSGMRITTTELILLVICAILLFTACISLFLLVRYCKRRHTTPRNDNEYMVDTQTAGPRPYNVESISRQVAQNMLSSRPLPDPFEDHKAQMAYTLAGPRSKNFSGNVQSVQTLIQNKKEGKVIASTSTDPVCPLNSGTEHFPIYRSQGYGNCC